MRIYAAYSFCGNYYLLLCHCVYEAVAVCYLVYLVGYFFGGAYFAKTPQLRPQFLNTLLIKKLLLSIFKHLISYLFALRTCFFWEEGSYAASHTSIGCLCGLVDVLELVNEL